MNLEEVLAGITPVDENARRECLARWDSIAKPLGSLGKLEDAIVQIAGITGSHQVCLDKKALVVMCADNGVVAEGVTQTGSEITALVSENLLDHKTSSCIMARLAGADVYPVDIGINRDTRLINQKIAYGTKNMLEEPAMTRSQAIQAIETGIRTALELKKKGYHILATGEMGIGNTTTSSAIASVLLHLPPKEVTGKGAGLSEAGLLRKIQVIEDSIRLHQPDPDDPLDVLSKVGGFDIAGLTGLFLGGAMAKIPVVMDGFISSVAALLALRMQPELSGYLLPSHVSDEPAGKRILETMRLSPFLTCNMRLGEGTGALALFPLLDMGLAVYDQMSTFEQIEMQAYQPL